MRCSDRYRLRRTCTAVLGLIVGCGLLGVERLQMLSIVVTYTIILMQFQQDEGTFNVIDNLY